VGQTVRAISPQRQPDGRNSGEESTRLIDTALAGLPQSFEWQHVRCDGSAFDTEVSLHSVELREGTMVQVIVRDITERKQAEQERRAFYRETILNATDGKLLISDEVDIEPYVSTAGITIDLSSPSEVGLVRDTAKRFLSAHGLFEDRLNDFLIAISEGTANVAKHAGSGHIYVGADNVSVWAVVSDRGPGISSLILPKAVLLRGFSTKPSMGLGYSVMLQLADRVLLKTDRNGTDVVMIKFLHEEPVDTLASIPDTWEGIESW
jgi:PAS domain S-box-containing protein